LVLIVGGVGGGGGGRGGEAEGGQDEHDAALAPAAGPADAARDDLQRHHTEARRVSGMGSPPLASPARTQAQRGREVPRGCCSLPFVRARVLTSFAAARAASIPCVRCPAPPCSSVRRVVPHDLWPLFAGSSMVSRERRDTPRFVHSTAIGLMAACSTVRSTERRTTTSRVRRTQRSSSYLSTGSGTTGIGSSPWLTR
jgi:hypothetical protein